MNSRAADQSGATMYCVELNTPNWATMVDWYRNAVGLRVMLRVVDDGYALLAGGGARLALIAKPDPTPAGDRWRLVLEVEDLKTAANRLLQHGAPILAMGSDAEGLPRIDTVDPDGNRVRLFTWPAM